MNKRKFTDMKDGQENFNRLIETGKISVTTQPLT